jgi:pantoate--beta-alanine ligase
MQDFSSQIKREGKTIGFVPTMGYLHEGHISLLKKSKEKCDIAVVSIFVNPTQFAPNEDFSKYPRDLDRDSNLLNQNGCDVLFYPDASEIYSDDYQTYVDVNEITKILEGESRPTHFRGVTTVVSILFNCVKPDYTFFGQKDAQQAAVIIQMVKDLKFDIKVIVCPIIREKDGLAMSSRNIYLSAKERKDALVLRQSLDIALSMIAKGEKKKEAIISAMTKHINSVDTSKLDYIQIVEAKSFKIADTLESNKQYYILIACRIGKTRLIDNELVTVL